MWRIVRFEGFAGNVLQQVLSDLREVMAGHRHDIGAGHLGVDNERTLKPARPLFHLIFRLFHELAQALSIGLARAAKGDSAIAINNVVPDPVEAEWLRFS